MNFTLLSLHFIHFISKSPSFSVPLYQSKTNFNFLNCQFSYFLTNAYFSSNIYTVLKVKNSNFRFFLDTSIKIDETYVTNAHVKFNRVAIYDTFLVCKDSTFSDCQSMFGQGGAISSLSSTILNNCFFIRCESEIGGAIFSGSDIDYISTTFISCIGIKSGGCVYSDRPDKIIISYCSFCQSMSATGGALCSNSAGQSIFRYNNVTTCGSFLSNGALDLAFLKAEIYYDIFNQCFAAQSTSGIRFYKNKGISINSVLFIFMASSEVHPDEGAILTIIDPAESVTISHSSFAKTQKVSSYSIYANYSISNSKKFEIKIVHCCFSYKKEFEFNNDTIIIDNNQQSLFLTNCDDFIQFMMPRKFGYQAEIKEVEIPLIDKLAQKYVIWFISTDAFYLLLVGFAIGFVSWLAFFLLIKRPRHRRNRQRRPFQIL